MIGFVYIDYMLIYLLNGYCKLINLFICKNFIWFVRVMFYIFCYKRVIMK